MNKLHEKLKYEEIRYINYIKDLYIILKLPYYG